MTALRRDRSTEAAVRTLHNVDAQSGGASAPAASAVEAQALHRASSHPDGRAGDAKAWPIVYEGRKSLWALSHCLLVDRALDRAYFAELGFFSLEHKYRELHRVVAPAQMSLALE